MSSGFASSKEDVTAGVTSSRSLSTSATNPPVPSFTISGDVEVWDEPSELFLQLTKLAKMQNEMINFLEEWRINNSPILIF
jgi:hypothetical protein